MLNAFTNPTVEGKASIVPLRSSQEASAMEYRSTMVLTFVDTPSLCRTADFPKSLRTAPQ